MNNVKFVIKAISLENDWTVDFYQHWDDFLLSDDEFQIKLNKLIKFVSHKNIECDFRSSLEIKASQFLVGVFPSKKQILLTSKYMNVELSLSKILDRDDSNEALKLKAHMSSIASIPVENSPTVIDFITFEKELADFSTDHFEQIHRQSFELAESLTEKVSEYKSTLFERVSDFGLDLTANFMLIRIHLLKFLAVLPSLDHDKSGNEVKKVFLETLRRLIDDSTLAAIKGLKGQKKALPSQYVFGAKILKVISEICPAYILASSIRFAVSKMAKRFIAGENIATANQGLKELNSTQRDATLDQLGELVVSEKEADEYMNKVLEIIHGLKEHIPVGSVNKANILRSHVSIKVSALCSDFKPSAFDYTYSLVAPRLIKILKTAKKERVFINIDAEHYHYRDIVFEIYKKVLLSTPDLFDYKDTGIVVQAYLRDGYDHFLDVVELAKQRKILMPIRLVKGAYWDAETVEGDAHNFNAPQFLNKEETDIHFRQIVCKALSHGDNIQLALASHNIQDHCFAEALRDADFPKSPKIEHQCLHMTYEALSMGLAKMGWATRNYIPIGDLLVGMAYLVRRIMENSSQVGILTIMRSHKKMMSSQTPLQRLREKQLGGKIDYDLGVKELDSGFRNIFPLRTYVKAHFNYFTSIFNAEAKKLKAGAEYNLGETNVISSSYPSLVLGKVHYDNEQEVSLKVDKLFNGFINSDWNNNDRFAVLYKFADLLLQQREKLSALIMFEAGKTLEEALADVDEAIDFVHFYTKNQIDFIHSENVSAKGVFGVIAPWNFPLAIPCGMTVAALCAGNSVILKPAEQTPLIALEMVNLAYKAGVPESALQLSIGDGITGKAIVDHELVNGIVFTGSKAVGESIYYKLKGQFTSKRYPFAPMLKTVITEMGGKNAIVVTNNCELDETVSGVIYSAFAHSGQKCSAASRVIIDNQVKESFINRFVDAVKDLKVGVSDDFSTMVNPLISKEDQQRVKLMAIKAREEVIKTGGRILVDDSSKSYPGFCVGPSVFEVSSKVAQAANSVAQTEIFGPMVHIIGYDTLEEAVDIFNSTQYALTGGIFSQSQDDIDFLMPQLLAGNIYINRPNTGARVAIEPFGGFKMSGTGPKAGSKDYLRSFVVRNPKEVNTNVSTKWGDESLNQMVQKSGLSYGKRLSKVQKLIDELLVQFEVYLNSIREDDKRLLNSLKSYLLSESNNLETCEFPNRNIPGQLNFDKRNLGIGPVIMVVGSKEIGISELSYFLLNLVVGNGLSVVCVDEGARHSWTRLVDLAYRSGLSTFNLQVVSPHQSVLEHLLKRPYALVMIEGDLEEKQKFVNMALKDRFEDFMRKVIVIDENDYQDDWYEYLFDLTHGRSFAVNTMRHGAPLELTL